MKGSAGERIIHLINETRKAAHPLKGFFWGDLTGNYVRRISMPMFSVRGLQLIAAIALLCFVGQGVAAELEHLGSAGIAHTDHHDGHRHIPSGENEMSSEHGEHHHHHLADMLLLSEGGIICHGLAISANSISEELIYEGPVFAIDCPPQLS